MSRALPPHEPVHPTRARLSRIVGRAAIIATLITVVISQSVLAAWSSAADISASGEVSAWFQSTTVTDQAVAHAVYAEGTDGSDVFYRRSLDGGAIWEAPIELSRPAAVASTAPSIEHYRKTLDVVWLEIDAADHFRVWYRSSPDAGTTWTDPMFLSPALGDAGVVDVARTGLNVAVVYTNGQDGKVYLRRSADGGQTFAARQQIATTTYRPYQGVASFDGLVAVAFSGGGRSLHLVWHLNRYSLRTRRSLDRGVTWGRANTLASNTDGRAATLTTRNANVMVGYTSAVAGYWRATMRIAFERGRIWRPAIAVGPRRTFAPHFVLTGTTLKTVYEACTTTTCTRTAVYHRRSQNYGSSWSAATRVTTAGDGVHAWPVGFAELAGGDTVLVYHRLDGAAAYYLRARQDL